MNKPEQPGRLMPIPDVQSGTRRAPPRDRPGRHPRSPAIRSRSPTATAWRSRRSPSRNVYVALPEDRKGTHMSRLVMLLEERAAPGARAADRRQPARPARRSRGAPRRARRPHRARVPVLRAQDGAGVGRGEPARLRGPARPASSPAAATRTTVDRRGAGHVAVPVLQGNRRLRRAQPALDRSRSPCAPTRRCSSHELLRIAEEEASCELYGMLKRADEKYVTERAYDNPRFVEDLVRGVAGRLAADPRFDGVQRRGRELRVDPQPFGLRADRARACSAVARLRPRARGPRA